MNIGYCLWATGMIFLQPAYAVYYLSSAISGTNAAWWTVPMSVLLTWSALLNVRILFRELNQL